MTGQIPDLALPRTQVRRNGTPIPFARLSVTCADCGDIAHREADSNGWMLPLDHYCDMKTWVIHRG